MSERARWLRTLRHARPGQLLHRARLLAKRRVLTWAPWLARSGVSAAAAPIAPIAATLPRSVLPARHGHVVARNGRRELALLGRAWPLALPLSWHPSDLSGRANLTKFHLHYMEWLESLDPEEVVPFALDWIAANPPFARESWTSSWSAYTLSLRTVVWMQRLAEPEVGFDADSADGRALRASIAGQLTFLARNLELDLGGNHLLKNLVALLWGARFFDGPADRRRGRRAARRLSREIDRQILADGMHYERSPAYHLQVFADLLSCYVVAPHGRSRARLGERLDAMAAVATDLTHPDGCPSLFNDGGLRMAYAPADLLAAHRELRGNATTPRPSFSLPSAGYFGARTGEELFLADCGPIAPDPLPAHGHGDVLSFEWSLGDERIVTDTGVFEYVPGERRAYARSTRAHNTVTLDGLDQAEFWESFRVGRRPRATVLEHETRDGGFRLSGEHDGYRHLPGEPVHERTFDVRPGRVEVRDRLRGGAGQHAVARVLLGPTLVPVPSETCRFRSPAVELTLETDAPWTLRPAPWYPDFGVRTETTMIELDYGTAPTERTFSLTLRRRA